MAGYLLIASRDPFESVEIQSFFGLAQSLSRNNEAVTVLLIQNGVFPARAGEGARWIDELVRAGVEVLADEFSLRERGIPASRLAKGVTPVSLDVAIDHLAQGRKALWH